MLLIRNTAIGLTTARLASAASLTSARFWSYLTRRLQYQVIHRPSAVWRPAQCSTCILFVTLYCMHHGRPDWLVCHQTCILLTLCHMFCSLWLGEVGGSVKMPIKLRLCAVLDATRHRQHQLPGYRGAQSVVPPNTTLISRKQNLRSICSRFSTNICNEIASAQGVRANYRWLGTSVTGLMCSNMSAVAILAGAQWSI